MSKNILYFITAGVILVALGVVGFYFTQQPDQDAQGVISQESQQQEQGLGGDLYDQIQNPAVEVPETNPFEAETNPFQQVKTNPFENYQNPFGE